METKQPTGPKTPRDENTRDEAPPSDLPAREPGSDEALKVRGGAMKPLDDVVP